MEEITYIQNATGRQPKLRGFELLAYSPNINIEQADEACLTEIYENQHTLETAMKWISLESLKKIYHSPYSITIS